MCPLTFDNVAASIILVHARLDPGPAKSAATNQADQGSPLTVLNFYAALRREKATGARPYVPGGMICWELMVGNSNTRWHWGTAAGSPEPAIPWDAWVFPDGTPISYTEVAAFRKYVTGVDDFLRFDDFLPAAEFDGDVTLPLPAGSAVVVNNTASASQNSSHRGSTAIPDSALYEATVWVAYPGDGNITMVVHGNKMKPVAAASAAAAPALHTTGGARDVPPAGSKDTCTQSAANIFNGTDIAGANFKGISYRTMDISKVAEPLQACAAACCAWNGCGAWVVQSGTGPSQHDHNCTKSTTTCCWLKPDGAASHTANPLSTAGVVTASPARPVIPPPPPPFGPRSPDTVGGYHVVIVGATSTLQVERRDPTSGSGSIEVLGPTFDLTVLENGIVLEAWNILRVTTTWKPADEHQAGASLCISVYFNPMFKETGFVGNASDAARVPEKLPPRLVACDPSALPHGEMYLTAGGRNSQVDYASVLPISVL